MKICMVGGGNMGIAMAAYAARNRDNEVIVYTQTHEESWENGIEVIDGRGNTEFVSHIACVTKDLRMAVENSDLVIITHPANMFAETIHSIRQFLRPDALVGFIPGFGGAEFEIRKAFSDGGCTFGVDRVPYIARVQTPGRTIYVEPKKSIRLCAFPGSRTAEICLLMETIFGIPCEQLKCYLSITLTPSNPILHTARLYSLFKGREKELWNRNPFFYREWDDAASELMLGCDEELQAVCRTLSDLPLEVIPLREHYEAKTVDAMTQKLRSIKSWENIKSPMLQCEGGYTIDFASRYFKADFLYGLCIIKGFADICHISTPNMDKLLGWYEDVSALDLLVDGELAGDGRRLTGAPQNYGIRTIEDIYAFYK